MSGAESIVVDLTAPEPTTTPDPARLSPGHRQPPPLATVVTDDRGHATTVGVTWSALTGQRPCAALGQGWLDAIEPVDRHSLLESIRSEPDAGHADCRVLATGGPRWMRWSWHRTDRSRLQITVVDVDDLWERATLDPLTGLCNRRELLAAIEGALERGRGSGEMPAVLYIDLDGFKTVNDAWGHRVGDQVLTAVAARIAAATHPTDLVGRVGGDEFAVLCDRPPSGWAAAMLARRIDDAVAATQDELAAGVTASIGIARAVRSDTSDILLARADEAMYARRAKPPTPWTEPGRAERADGDDGGSPNVADLVHHLLGLGVVLHGSAVALDPEAADRLRAAMDDLDHLADQIRMTTPEGRHDGDRASAALGVLREVVDATAEVLRDEWFTTVGQPSRVPQRDRLSTAARHVRAAARILEPGSLG